MRFNQWIPFIGFLFLVGVLVAPTHVEAQPFRWKLSAGDRFQAEFMQQTEIRTVIQETVSIIRSEMDLVFDWEVTDVDEDQNATIRQTLVSIRGSVDDPAKPANSIVFDTGNTETKSSTSRKTLAQLKPLMGLKWSVVMTARGEITDVKIPTASQELIDSLPEGNSLKRAFEPTTLQQRIAASAFVLPAEELKVGQSWKSEHPLKTGSEKNDDQQNDNLSGETDRQRP